jgi:hypothetical protein
MNDQNEQTILDWLRENLNLRGLRSLFSRPAKVEKQIAEDTYIKSEEVKPEIPEQLTSSIEPNVTLVSEVSDAPVSSDELVTTKISHVVIAADIPEGMILNITIQTNAEGKADVSSRMIPAQVAEISRPMSLPNLKGSQTLPIQTGYSDRLGKFMRRRWQWVLVIGALLVYLFVARFPNSGNITDDITADVVKTDIQVEGENIEVSYSPIDMGQPKDIFDEDFVTLMRGAEANPYILNFNFSNPRHLSGILGKFARMDYRITVDLYPPDGNTPVHYEFTDSNITTDVELEMMFENAPDQVKRVYMEILQLNPGEEVHIHIRQITFLP